MNQQTASEAPRLKGVPEAIDLVLFGALGDLSQRKLLPALYQLDREQLLDADTRLLGLARQGLELEGFRARVESVLRTHVKAEELDPATLQRFLGRLAYGRLDFTQLEGYTAVRDWRGRDAARPLVVYLAVEASLYGDICHHLQASDSVDDNSRVVVEKPIGHDLASSEAINDAIAAVFPESRIYRIDHYLGKETVQNLMAVRFGNMLFEPLWNSQYIDHIQITVAETVGVAGRGEYYDRAGAMRDMVQNHLMQLLCLIAMEPPARFEPGAVRDEKLKVIRALEPVEPDELVRGQYEAGDDTPGYAEDVGQEAATSESFIALKAHISNWRWAGTPFYIRTGKRLKERASEIAVVFKDTPHSIFDEDAGRHRNILTIRLQPNEGIELGVTIKEPGPGGMRLIDVPLDMSFAEALGPEAAGVADAYERLIMDVIRGNQTLFMRDDEVEAAWGWTDPIIGSWQERGDTPLPYAPGSSGPHDALMLMHQDGRRWREIKA